MINILKIFFTLLLVINNNSIIYLINAQSLSAIELKTSCNGTSEYFDISRLTCLNCPGNSRPIDSKYKKDYKFLV